MKTRTPITRTGNSWFVRVYRAWWVGPRSFADRDYGSKEKAMAAAQKWHAIAEERLPKIPPKPVRKKATLHVREGHEDHRIRPHVDVYLPSPHSKRWKQPKLYFSSKDGETRQKALARNMVANQNQLLADAFQKDMAKWKAQYDKVMDEIQKRWYDIKTMPIN